MKIGTGNEVSSATRNNHYAVENNPPTSTQLAGRALKWIAGGIVLLGGASLGTGMGLQFNGPQYNVSSDGYGLDQLLLISGGAAELGGGFLWLLGSAMTAWGNNARSESVENPFLSTQDDDQLLNGSDGSITFRTDSGKLAF